ncbi:MAG TPA: hypothetical protein DCQ83_05575 [Fibrobacteres bacterium]|jgi:cellulose synthase/poly-beta-1,6-N-acetylglucosamine synthase-like glycosyltransferase|nr:hypothetical protein [Fibrobacterota bacterium]
MISLLFYLACAGYILLDLQLLRGLFKLKKRNRPENRETPTITVLIAARNEERNLPHVLDVLLAQDYPVEKFNVIVVNDRSNDGTENVLRSYSERNPDKIRFMTITEVSPGMSPKKHALMRGLEQAQGEWIAVTDADCTMGPRWLSSLSHEFNTDTGMVLGLTAYAELKNGFGWGTGTQALEFISYGIVSASLVGLGFPVIANANNLAYRRKAFEDAGGFRGHGNVVSGDDDFILQAIHATGQWTTKFCSTPESLVRTAAPESWAHFWEQRKRWASKCLYYRLPQKLFLAIVFAFYAAIPLLLLAGIICPWYAWLGICGFAVKTVSDFAVMRSGLRGFGLSSLLRWFPGTALLHIPLILAAVVAGTTGGFTWKGQRLSKRV